MKRDPLIVFTPKYLQYKFLTWTIAVIAFLDGVVIFTMVTKGASWLMIAVFGVLTGVDGFLAYLWRGLRRDLGISDKGGQN